MKILGLIVCILFVIVVLLHIGEDRGCRGSCCQGRKPCDCEDKE